MSVNFYNSLKAAQADGVHIDKNTKKEKVYGATRYSFVQQDYSDNILRACVIAVAAAAIIFTLGIALIFSQDLRANLFGRRIVTVDVADPVAAKTNNTAKKRMPKPTFDINTMPSQEILDRFVDKQGKIRNNVFLALSGQEMLDLSRRLPNMRYSASEEEIRSILNTLPLESLTKEEFTYFFGRTGFLFYATKPQVDLLWPHLTTAQQYHEVRDQVFCQLQLTEQNTPRMLDHRGTNVSRLSKEQIQEHFHNLIPYLQFLTVEQITKGKFTDEQIDELKARNHYAQSHFAWHQTEKPPFSYNLTVTNLPATGALRNFYTKFKQAEKDKAWHKVFDLPQRFTQKELKTNHKKLLLQLHPDKNREHQEAAVKIQSALNALYAHLKT